MPERSLVKFKSLTARDRLTAFLAQPFYILRVEDPCAPVFSLHVLQSETGVIEHCLICIPNRSPVRFAAGLRNTECNRRATRKLSCESGFRRDFDASI